MNIIVYSKDNCPYCKRAKALLNAKDLPFTECILGKDILREDFVSLFPDAKTVPLIFIDGKRIGGYNELVEWNTARQQSPAG